MFTPDQKAVLLRYFEEYGMTSTHRRNTDLMQRCAEEVGTTIDRIKVWLLHLVLHTMHMCCCFFGSRIGLDRRQ